MENNASQSIDQTLSSQDDLLPRFFQLALANVVSNIMVPLANTLSVAFLGHLSEIHHLAGVALAGNLTSLVFLLLISLRMSTTGLTAQAVGRDDQEAILLVGLRNGLIALVLGVAIVSLKYPLQELGFTLLNATPQVKASAIAYFNAQIWGAPAVLLNFVLIGWFLGQEKSGLVVLLSVVGNVANIALDYLLIIRWGWESMGAGVSYTTSQYLSLLVGLIVFCLEIEWQDLRAVAGEIWDTSAIISSFTLNGNIFVSNFIFLLVILIFNYESAALGTITYAENALILQIFFLSSYFTEGLGFGTETLSGNFQGKGESEQLKALVRISVGTSLLVGLIFAGVCVLFPQTVFKLLTNHTEITEQIDIYVFWLLPVLGFSSVAFMLDGYFLGLAEGHTLRNVTLASFAVGFLPADVAAFSFHTNSNHILWLALSLFLVVRLVLFGVQLPRTFKSDIPYPQLSQPVILEINE
ncbi:MATE family efflux transporter [Scytonema hofmannii PCC 7110]|uniref:Probable multidrug resistance protein NorM n=1 Tax=Scytonema hofmannii PCC 7110 TaxID=128403 RepID=A0A139WV79_9CYAN|nr:guanitoxin biosynthesis MATE family efflux transporter GntT [Scytonema hofmannii]KYC36324.1 MATE family efflux transporter [Scytonema hofmannii PCC 7110]